MTDINYDLLPEHIRPAVRRYIEEGTPVGGFLTAVITNNLSMAFGQADEINLSRLFDIVNFFWTEAPGPCWGSRDKMQAWMAHEGQKGKAR